jgi:hypothetical protein
MHVSLQLTSASNTVSKTTSHASSTARHQGTSFLGRSAITQRSQHLQNQEQKPTVSYHGMSIVPSAVQVMGPNPTLMTAAPPYSPPSSTSSPSSSSSYF